MEWPNGNIIQVEQEFGLILGKSHAKREFIADLEWSTKYVPAIISYGQNVENMPTCGLLLHNQAVTIICEQVIVVILDCGYSPT